ncbi:MAG: cyclic nucleotide-binding domain-containing protein [Deltaproteobacteria bacterium]|nr:cyclic nucleotide-binding domain-containing protein [Deltaproteobacteria bacterium]
MVVSEVRVSRQLSLVSRNRRRWPLVMRPGLRIDMFVQERRASMKSFNWHDMLRGHSIFSSLREDEIANLLRDEISQEHSYAPGTTIIKEGDAGDSMFLLSVGSVQVALTGNGGPMVRLAVIQAGEIFGEMAVLERKPRSATVFAAEHCLLLEIGGTDIRQLLEAHPAMQVKLYTVARDRLSHWFRSLGPGESRGNN